MSIKKFNEFNEINEGKLKDFWKKVVKFFSSKDANVIREIDSTNDKSEKNKILNEHIEDLAQQYIKEVKTDKERFFSVIDLAIRIKKFLDIYKKINHKKHPRDTWREEYLGGHFVWKELLKIKDPDKLDEYFKNKIDKLKGNQKQELENLKAEYKRFKSMVSEEEV